MVERDPIATGPRMSSEPKNNPPEPCAICRSTKLFSLPAVIASVSWPICGQCAAAGAALMQEGAIKPVAHCLQLVAMEIEAFAEGFASDPNDRLAKRWLYRIQRELSRGAVRSVCPCARCTGHGPVMVVTDMFDMFDVPAETHADTMPLAVLKSMAPGHKVRATDGSTWRAVDEVARRLEANAFQIRRGPVGPLARAASPTQPGEWADSETDEAKPKRDTYRPIKPDHRAKRDAETKVYWAAFRKWGRGRVERETNEYVTDDGRRYSLKAVPE